MTFLLQLLHFEHIFLKRNFTVILLNFHHLNVNL